MLRLVRGGYLNYLPISAIFDLIVPLWGYGILFQMMNATWCHKSFRLFHSFCPRVVINHLDMQLSVEVGIGYQTANIMWSVHWNGAWSPLTYLIEDAPGKASTLLTISDDGALIIGSMRYHSFIHFVQNTMYFKILSTMVFTHKYKIQTRK